MCRRIRALCPSALLCVGGSEITYRRELALVLAWAGRSRGALALAQEGLARDPSDYQLLFPRAVALRDGYEYGLARAQLFFDDGTANQY